MTELRPFEVEMTSTGSNAEHSSKTETITLGKGPSIMFIFASSGARSSLSSSTANDRRDLGKEIVHEEFRDVEKSKASTDLVTSAAY